MFQVFGHSLGAGLATLTSSYVVEQGLFTPDKVKQVTTGETRCGNIAMAQYHDQMVSKIFDPIFDPHALEDKI